MRKHTVAHLPSICLRFYVSSYFSISILNQVTGEHILITYDAYKLKQKLSSIKKITWMTVIADKKMISVFGLSVVLCSLRPSAIQVK